ncbi:MAG TPA: class I SAM-dependent methyltransferase [Rectinemataceae bacterium]|nr:class I SAM-dependent methyltransferase [Rectinemataceae bacterium]
MKTFATKPRPESFTPRPCAICGSQDFRPLWNLESFSYVICAECGLVQQNPQPDPEFVLARYDDSYRDYEVERQGDYARLERLALGDLGFAELGAGIGARAAAQGRSPTFLDVGCATGALIAGLEKEGWKCVGVEPCVPAARFGRSLGLDIRPCVLEEAELASASFDVVHASHLIEHLNDPSVFLLEARRLLAPGGLLIITTPNIDGLQARLLGPAWRSAIYDHLYLFSKRSLRRLLEKSGFELRRRATWGGWAAGLKPAFLKKPLDRLVKPLGIGDVMAFLCLSAPGEDRGRNESGRRNGH